MTDTNSLAIALAQLNPVLGDVLRQCREGARSPRPGGLSKGRISSSFPSFSCPGIRPKIWCSNRPSRDACRAALDSLARETDDGGPAVLVGLPWVEDGKLYNAVALLDGGRIAAVRFKVDLPNYGPFDEKRVFASGPMPGPIVVRGVRVGVPICEDIWGEEVVECLAETGAEMLIVPNGSPFCRGKGDERFNIAAARVTESELPLIYVNQVGGQDELVFDGASFVLQDDCALACQLPAFAETVALTRWSRADGVWRCADAPRELVVEGEKADYAACVLGLRDYVEKKTASPACCSGCPGASIRLCVRRLPSMRWGLTGCIA